MITLIRFCVVEESLCPMFGCLKIEVLWIMLVQFSYVVLFCIGFLIQNNVSEDIII